MEKAEKQDLSSEVGKKSIWEDLDDDLMMRFSISARGDDAKCV